MSGRHRAAAERSRRPPLVPTVIAASLIVLLLAAIPVVLLWPEATPASGRTGCAVLPEVTISAPAAIAPVIDKAGKRATAAGACATFLVESAESAQVMTQIAAGGAPDVWVPDSGLWIGQLNELKPYLPWSEGAVVATSPVVLAAGPDQAPLLGAKPSWTSLASTSLRIADPRVDSTGLVSLMSVQAAYGTAASTAADTVLAGLARRVAGSGADLIGQLAGGTVVAPISEQALVAYNAAHAGSPLTTAAPAEGSQSLQYQWVPRPDAPPSLRELVQAIPNQINSTAGTADLKAAGLRNSEGAFHPVGSPLPDGSAKAGGRLSAAEIASTMSTWEAATADLRMLAVIDVSGSMKRSAGSRSRIDLAQAATLTALETLPADSQVGLWAFSTNRKPGSQDWEEIAPIRLLTADAGGQTQRELLTVKLDGFNSLVRGDTGLYDTLLAAVKRVRSTYAAGYSNSVVLLTDGENDDANTMSRAQLIQKLAAERDPAKPVRIVLVAMGPEADSPGLQALAKDIGGTAYTAQNPQDIDTVLVQALLSRR